MFNPGDAVTYTPSHGKWEKGIVKRVSDSEHSFVVYNCGGKWERYEDYTAARTCNSDLVAGWQEKPVLIKIEVVDDEGYDSTTL